MSKLNQMKFLLMLNEEAARLAKELGVEIDRRENEDSLMIRLKADPLDEQAQFEKYQFRFGYPAWWFGELFEAQGSLYRIEGVRPSAETNCLKIRRMSDKKSFVCKVGFVTLSSKLREPAAA